MSQSLASLLQVENLQSFFTWIESLQERPAPEDLISQMAPGQPEEGRNVASQPFHDWMKQRVIFHEGHPQANPVCCYLRAHLEEAGQQTPVILHQGWIYTRSGAEPLPVLWKNFVHAFHQAFNGMHPDADTLFWWVNDGCKPAHLTEEVIKRFDTREAIMNHLQQVIELSRIPSLDPTHPSDEYLLGVALSKYCGWDLEHIAQVGFHLFMAACEDSNLPEALFTRFNEAFQEIFQEDLFNLPNSVAAWEN